MMRRIFSWALVGGAVAIGLGAAVRAEPFVLKSVDVTLPDGDSALPGAPGLETVENNCRGCHSPGMILNQPAMPRAAWEAEVTKMRNVYRAPVDESDVPAIVDYLVAVKGAK